MAAKGVTLSRGFRLWLIAKFALISGGGPLLVLFLRLWAGALIAYFAIRRAQPVPKDRGAEIGTVPLRFAALAPIITGVTWLLWPEPFLSRPRERPAFWAIVMVVLYPVLSVWPQEMLYRACSSRDTRRSFQQMRGGSWQARSSSASRMSSS